MEFPIANGFYRSESLPMSCQEAINCYPVINSVPSLSQEVVFPTPGITQLATTGTLKQFNRGTHTMAGIPYFVNGGRLWHMHSDYSLSDSGSISGLDRVSMADNGSQLMILQPGGAGYIYEKDSTTLTEIVDADFRANGNPQIVVMIDGYFCCTTDEKKFIVSDLGDGLSWIATDFGAAESDPDDPVAPAKVGNRLFIFGSETGEEFQNIGGAGFPFQRTGFIIPKGLFAKFAIVEAQGSLIWVGGGKNEAAAVWMLSGNQYQKVSTTPIDYLLKSLLPEDLAAIYAMSYSDNGAAFVEFSLPDTTIVYDVSTNRWHERRSYIDETLTRSRVASITKAYNKTICADAIDGRIGEFDNEVYTEYGEPIIRRITCQPFYNQGKSFFIPQMELLMETGVGNDACEEPLIEMEMSKDGKTWSIPRPRKMGKRGERKKRVIWTRTGRASNYEIARFTTSSPVKFIAYKLLAEIEGGVK